MSGLAYYNECDPYAAEWLRNLIAAGHITPGDVDTRSIVDVRPSDVAGYTRCHWFAGIGIWDCALGLAGWPAGLPVWTGSCPCQPFSAAGGRSGFADERHLWPAWYHLVRECRPAIVLGEQSASNGALHWLDLVQADLEAAGYACGPVDLCAIGGEHKRQRLWFVAHADGWDTSSEGLQRGWEHRQQPQVRLARPRREYEWLVCRDGQRRAVEPGTLPVTHAYPGRLGRVRPYGNAIDAEAAAAFIGAVIDTLSPTPTPGGLAEGGRS